MGDDSKIQWTDATWNPVRGCSRVSEGCRNCYAERQAARFCKPGEPFHGFAKIVAPRDSLDRVGGRRNGWTGNVELIPDMLDVPLYWRRPRRVFVNSMSDLFHEALSDDAIASVFGVMAVAATGFGGQFRDGAWHGRRGPHTFQILTKRAERMRATLSSSRFREAVASHAYRYAHDLVDAGWLAQCITGVRETGNHCTLDQMWPLPNVWLGVSVEDQATADARIPVLLDTPAAVRFVSYEPALGPVDFRRQVADRFVHDLMQRRDGTRLDWLIVGGESGPGARPCDVAWIRSAVAQCKAASVACFVKQLGARPFDGWEPDHDPNGADEPRWMGLRDRKGGDPSEWPADLRVREFPEARRG